MACTVLLVEDDADIRDALSDELVELGCEVVSTETATLALARLQRGLKPDFVLLDLLLPEMSGTELLKTMKSDASLAAIPVVLMSASRVSAVVGAEKSGAQPVLQKPLRRWQLEQIVEWFAGTAQKRSEPA